MSAGTNAVKVVVVDLSTLSVNFPPSPRPEVTRDNVVSTLKTLLQDSVYAVAVEGSEGIGKTTVFSQFVLSTPHSVVSIFVSPSNRLSYDPDLIRLDVAGQVCWASSGEILDRSKYDPSLLKAYYSDLQRRAKQRKEQVYFIVDGAEELDPSDRAGAIQHLQDILPIGIPQFRFLFSGDASIYRTLIPSQLTLKSFPLTEFGLEETRMLFSGHDLPIELIRDINVICRGLPGRLSGVLRAMARGTDPRTFVENTPTEFFDVDWKQVDASDVNAIRILALLAHDLRPHGIKEIASIIEVPIDQVSESIARLTFLIVDPSSGYVRFATDGLRRYVSERLKDKKANIQKLLIKRLVANPQESVLDLPEYLEEASEFQHLLDLLTPEHILRILERSQTLSRVDDTVLRGFRSAEKLERDADLLRFGIQKSIIAELALANIWESEVAALTVLNREAEALALANNAVLREDRLQMLAAVVHGVWLRGDTVRPEILDQIRPLIDNLNYWSLGRRANSIASKLICVDPDLAITLLKKAKSSIDDAEIDFAFAHLTLTALSDLKDERRRIETLQTAARIGPEGSHAATLLDVFTVLSGNLSPEDVCARSQAIQQEEAKVTILRYWCIRDGHVRNADLVALHALRVALGSTSMQIDASFLSDLSNALPGAPDPSRTRELIASLDGVRATAERLGPSVDYVKLQLSIAFAEVDLDASAAEARLTEILGYVNAIGDLPSKGEAYAGFLGRLRTLPQTAAIASRYQLEQQCATDLENVVLILTEYTAEHHLALSGIICALAPGYLEKALEYTRLVNTESRRDGVLNQVVRALLHRPLSEINISRVLEVANIIVGSEARGKAVATILERFADADSMTEDQVKTLLPAMSQAEAIKESVVACRATVCSLKIIHRGGMAFKSMEDETLRQLRARWEKIDTGWTRIDAGFGIARDLAALYPDEANAILSTAEELKSEWLIAGDRAASAFIRCIRLTIRAFCGLLPRRLETETDVESLAALIEILPSNGERAVLWADVCMRTALVGRLDLTEEFTKSYLQPAFSRIPKEDAQYRERVLVNIAPGLYKTQPTVCLEALNTVSADARDSAIREIVRFLLFGRVPFDPIDLKVEPACKTNYDTLLNIANLTESLSTDWIIYAISEDVADAMLSRVNRLALNTPQRETIANRFIAIAEKKLPLVRHIAHHGYRIITIAQGLRMRQAKSAEWEAIVRAAEKLDNVADRALVVQYVALAFPTNMSDWRDKLLENALASIENIPWDYDQIERFIGLAENVREISSTLCRELVKQAASVMNKRKGSLSDQRRRVVDLAYRIDESLAEKLIEAFDDDEARRAARSQVKILEVKKRIAERSEGGAAAPKALDEIRSDEVSRLGASLVRALAAGRVQSLHPRDMRRYLELAAQHPLDRSYALFVWYVDNMVGRYANTDQAATVLRPVFGSCVVSAQLSGQVAGRALVRLKALKLQSAALTSTRSLLVTPVSREAAIQIVVDWIERNVADELMLHDPYFGPDDLRWIQLIRTARPECKILIMTSRRHQPTVQPGEELVDVYVNAWRKAFDQRPPRAEIAVIGGEQNRESPIHDRWLVSGAAGLRFGTSLNSLGVNKDSEISEMSSEDSVQKRIEMDQYLMRERTDFKGERLRLTRFWLT